MRSSKNELYIFPLAEPFIKEFLEPKPEMVISDLTRKPFLGFIMNLFHQLNNQKIIQILIFYPGLLLN